MFPLAHLTVGEWALLISPALAIAGAIVRAGKRLADRIEALLSSVAGTTRTVKSLEAQVNLQASAIDGLSSRMDRLDKLGTVPMKETLRILKDRVAPDVAAMRDQGEHPQ